MLLSKCFLKKIPQIDLTRFATKLSKLSFGTQQTSDSTVSVPFQHSGEDALLLAEHLVRDLSRIILTQSAKKTHVVQKHFRFDSFGTFSASRRGCAAPRGAWHSASAAAPCSSPPEPHFIGSRELPHSCAKSYLTQCNHQSVLGSQLPHKVVNLLFTITDENVKLAVLLGS